MFKTKLINSVFYWFYDKTTADTVLTVRQNGQKDSRLRLGLRKLSKLAKSTPRWHWHQRWHTGTNVDTTVTPKTHKLVKLLGVTGLWLVSVLLRISWFSRNFREFHDFWCFGVVTVPGRCTRRTTMIRTVNHHPLPGYTTTRYTTERYTPAWYNGVSAVLQ